MLRSKEKWHLAKNLLPDESKEFLDELAEDEN
jgi:hypothetical protein